MLGLKRTILRRFQVPRSLNSPQSHLALRSLTTCARYGACYDSSISIYASASNFHRLLRRSLFGTLIRSRNLCTMPESTGLSSWLAQSKAEYLQAVQSGQGADWTIVMGNEAGGE
jgi:hypothetical protein